MPSNIPGFRPFIYLAHIVILRVKTITQSRQQFWPITQLSLGNDCCDQNSNSGTDQGGWIANAGKALRFDEACHFRRELIKVCFYIVFQDQSTQRSGRFIYNRVKDLNIGSVILFAYNIDIITSSNFRTVTEPGSYTRASNKSHRHWKQDVNFILSEKILNTIYKKPIV